ncbi:hypothetical protein EDD33_2275 [Nocardioides aurantiacus]|uniref:Methyltransferase type 11 domain-containing protein n=1 Tax=Nocardioides aurantiacus TaxID=86796 RepID=A0A3N2CV94_9ACTN|nr:hypothetical protein EDD33_2275 [Nocardioides aurantiacus]
MPFVRERGVVSVLTSCVLWVGQWLLGRPRAGRPTTRTFAYAGRRVPYVHERYNYTWLNERAVELALAGEQLDAHAADRVLEVGHVLGHYRPVDHLVVDKYEQADRVLNVDVADLALDERFDLVLAVSTLEHVGLDEDVQDPDKPGRALRTLTSLLAPGGTLWLTVPVGYNPALERELREGSHPVASLRALRRDRWRNTWREVPVAEVWEVAYDRLLYTAHGLVVAEIRPDGAR